MAYTSTLNARQPEYPSQPECATDSQVIGGPLQEILMRIGKASNTAECIAAELREHADRVHGPVPENAAANSKDGTLGAVLPEIFNALSRLDRAQSELAEQAGRNCCLV